MKTTESIRWRGGQVTRIEALTDAVFGFAITLLVVSLEAPSNFNELAALMRGFVPFAFSFTLLILVWSYHYRLFSRFDLEDGITIVLNSILLFVVLFYVYPLKFVATFILSSGKGSFFSDWDQVSSAMTLYGTGFVAVFLVFALLYHHAYRLRDRMKLTPGEALLARQGTVECLVMVGAGLVSIVLAETVNAMVAGFSYFLIGPAQYANGVYFGRRAEQLDNERVPASA